MVGSLTPHQLRSARDRLGLTQAALAAKLGVSANTVARWERGEQPMPAMLILALFALRKKRKKEK